MVLYVSFLQQWGLIEKWSSGMNQALDQKELDLSSNLAHF